MPRFNSLGEWAAGVGGGVPGNSIGFTCNGTLVDPGPGGAGDWLNDDEIVTARWTSASDFATVAVHKQTGTRRLLRQGEFQRAWAGGGRWAVLAFGTWLLDDGRESFPILGIAPDGEIATTLSQANDGIGLVLTKVGRAVSHAHVWNLNLLGNGRAVWSEAGGHKAQGVPAPQLLPGAVWGLRVAFDGLRWWALYQSEATGTLVLHPFDSFQGHVLTAPGANAFRPDPWIPPAGLAKVVYATAESEKPHEVREITLALGQHTKDVRPSPTVPNPGTPAPNPGTPTPNPGTPEPEPMPTPVPDLKHVVANVRRNYPTPLGATHASLLAEVVTALRAERPDLRFGLLRKDGGDRIQMPSGVTVSQDIVTVHQGNELWTYDVLGSAETKADPAWMRTKPTGVEKDLSRFYEVRASDLPGQPEPDPDPPLGGGPPSVPPPEPLPTPDNSQLARIEAKLDRLLSVFRV